ncbi:hypothetical protein HOP50_10g58920 [Chloropicon primus]|uniref:S-adenosyl-L-methionine-dependent methyltransferase n=1 Tax=Chloropicon primus TaxID=1764295 RepID=A0A5B8MUD0_9CHLO|nr:hypothetical protein A3770_10p58720 [Chloropicon primus]UPR02566.1 hypothetical protein HOP50_10g58920 [Chloropicon primus]|eukprot:QDZ23354.1 hypothetical protein A3770_10p58720 [Chloropicon primus]
MDALGARDRRCVPGPGRGGLPRRGRRCVRVPRLRRLRPCCQLDDDVAVFGTSGYVLDVAKDKAKILAGFGTGDPFFDPRAPAAASDAEEGRGESTRDSIGCDRGGLLSTRYVDDSLLKAQESFPFIKQVVLFGCNLDTRPYRLQVASGIIFFDVAPEIFQAHKKAKLRGEKVRPGCLHVQVQVPSQASFEDIEKLLARRAFQGSKPSMWTLENMERYCSNFSQVENVLVHVSRAMAYDSVLVGTLRLPGDVVGGDQIKDVLAACNLKGECFRLRDFAAALHRSDPRALAEGGDRGEGMEGWLFYGSQVSRSAAEREIYKQWTDLAEEIDEDYFDNFR